MQMKFGILIIMRRPCQTHSWAWASGSYCQDRSDQTHQVHACMSLLDLALLDLARSTDRMNYVFSRQTDLVLQSHAERALAMVFL